MHYKTGEVYHFGKHNMFLGLKNKKIQILYVNFPWYIKLLLYRPTF